MPASDHHPPPIGAARRTGPLLILSGQLPRSADGQLMRGPIERQTAQVIDNIEALLAAHGLALTDVVKATAWLTDVSHVAGFNQVYATRFGAPCPARSTIIAAVVAPADVEIEVVALFPSFTN